MNKKLFVLMLAILMVPSVLLADSVLDKAKNLQVVKTLFPPQVKLVGAKDLGDIYELDLQPQKGGKHIYYVTKDGAYLIAGGNLINKDKVNLTQVRQSEIDRVDVSKLPLSEALKIKKGNGARTLIMFDDVECPFCRRAWDWLKTKDNYTLYVFLYPLNIHPQSAGKSVAILCAKDPLATLDRVMAGQDAGSATCSAGSELLAREKAVGDRVGVDGTPLFITDTGARIVGLQVPMLESYLKK
jgi:thiol:disulfide interchange protein DsbC